jgi:hypothetical protein
MAETAHLPQTFMREEYASRNLKKLIDLELRADKDKYSDNYRNLKLLRRKSEQNIRRSLRIRFKQKSQLTTRKKLLNFDEMSHVNASKLSVCDFKKDKGNQVEMSRSQLKTKSSRSKKKAKMKRQWAAMQRQASLDAEGTRSSNIVKSKHNLFRLKPPRGKF